MEFQMDFSPRTLFYALRRRSPQWIARYLDSLIVLRNHWRFGGLSTKELFSKIYRTGAWGRSPDGARRFYSGAGSHDRSIVGPYVESVVRFLQEFPGKPDVVDLGCGDFSVGSQIRHACGRYIACDIVDSVIESNRDTFAHLGVDFRVLDLTVDDIPRADVVIIREVLQHLSNGSILAAIPRIAASCRFLVLTERLPRGDTFPHNLDNRAPGIRLDADSGVVITSPPFSLQALQERCLCEVPASSGVVRTMLYRLA